MVNFPYKVLTISSEQPSYGTIAELHLQFNPNETPIYSNLGDRTLSHFSLAATPVVYNLLSTGIFVPQNNLGYTPVITPLYAST